MGIIKRIKKTPEIENLYKSQKDILPTNSLKSPKTTSKTTPKDTPKTTPKYTSKTTPKGNESEKESSKE